MMNRKRKIGLLIMLITILIMTLTLPVISADTADGTATTTMNYTTMALGGVSLPLLIQVVVGLAKKLGFPTAFCPHLAAGVGLVGAVAVVLIAGQPFYYGIVAGIMLGGLSCGIYDASKGTSTTDTAVDINTDT